MKLSLQIPAHFKCVATLPREMSDDALKPATPLTGCVINVDRACHVAPKQPSLKSIRLCCSGCPSTDGLSMLTMHDSQPAEESHCRWVWQSAAAFGWSRYWSVASLITQPVSGVAGLTPTIKKFGLNPPRGFCSPCRWNINPFCSKFTTLFGAWTRLQASPLDRFLRLIRQMTRFCATKCLFIVIK